MSAPGPVFSHERLIVYQKAIQFIAWLEPVLESLPDKIAAKDQLDRASTSICLNIAEGNVKASPRDRARFWQFAFGSTVECAACLDVLTARKIVSPELADEGKALLAHVARMLAKLLDSIGTHIAEDSPPYGLPADADEDEDADAEPLSGLSP